MAIGKLRGNAWVFGDIMDVDNEIFPFKLLMAGIAGRKMSWEEMGQYCMTAVDPDFPKKVKKGDFIVAGEEACGFEVEGEEHKSLLHDKVKHSFTISCISVFEFWAS